MRSISSPSGRPGTISRFGGHAYAAGLSLHETALARFVEEFERVGREWLSPALLKRTIETDGALAADELTLGLAQSCAAHVWGQGFPAPAFDAEFTVTAQRVVGDKHLKLALGAGRTAFRGDPFPADRRRCRHESAPRTGPRSITTRGWSRCNW